MFICRCKDRVASLACLKLHEVKGPLPFRFWSSKPTIDIATRSNTKRLSRRAAWRSTARLSEVGCLIRLTTLEGSQPRTATICRKFYSFDTISYFTLATGARDCRLIDAKIAGQWTRDTEETDIIGFPLDQGLANDKFFHIGLLMIQTFQTLWLIGQPLPLV